MATTSIGPSGVTFPNGTTQAAAATGTVTSITAGNGLTGGTITGSGTIALDYYTGTTVNNASFPIGSYIVTNGTSTGDTTYRDVNASFTVYSPGSSVGTMQRTSFSLLGTLGTGSTALAGTWRSRGAVNVSISCNSYWSLLMQRTA